MAQPFALFAKTGAAQLSCSEAPHPSEKDTERVGRPASPGIGGNAWESIVLRADAASLDSTESLAARTILFRSG